MRRCRSRVERRRRSGVTNEHAFVDLDVVHACRFGRRRGRPTRDRGRTRRPDSTTGPALHGVTSRHPSVGDLRHARDRRVARGRSRAASRPTRPAIAAGSRAFARRVVWRCGERRSTTRRSARGTRHAGNSSACATAPRVELGRRRVDGDDRHPHRRRCPTRSTTSPASASASTSDRASHTVEWLGRGPHESYSDRRASTRFGRWRTPSTTGPSPTCTRKRSGNRTGVRWLRFLDADGEPVLVVDQMDDLNVIVSALDRRGARRRRAPRRPAADATTATCGSAPASAASARARAGPTPSEPHRIGTRHLHLVYRLSARATASGRGARAAVSGVDAEGQHREHRRGDAVVDVALRSSRGTRRASRGRSARRRRDPGSTRWPPCGRPPSSASTSPRGRRRARATRGTSRTPRRSGTRPTANLPAARTVSASSVGHTKMRATISLPGPTSGATFFTSSGESQLMMAPSASLPAMRNMPGRSAATRIGGGSRHAHRELEALAR